MDPALRTRLQASLLDYHQQKCSAASHGGDSSAPSANKFINYGTAGFRGEASQVQRLFYNVGLVAGLRCMQVGANIGVMITASHNPVCDNGVKLIDPNGEMLEARWERIVENFCNVNEPTAILNEIQTILENEKIDCTSKCWGRVLIGFDTRPSSRSLVSLVTKALQSWSPHVGYINHGLLTTPALHYLVAESNQATGGQDSVSLITYYHQLSAATIDLFARPASSSDNYSFKDLVVDCANGVGFETMRFLANQWSAHEQLQTFNLVNVGDGTLNNLCGADYVKTVQKAPIGANQVGKRYASLDGDADRVVYFYLEWRADQLKLNLLDGDKIMALFALYLRDMIAKLNLQSQVSLGCVQTPYANGASTEFMSSNLGLRVEFADTGVKNLHKKALNYDFGIYFEANGHGTICISSKAKKLIRNGGGNEFDQLKLLLKLLNNYTGDAISDVLIVEAILRHYDWNVEKWYQIYQDRPSSLTKVVISDRNLIKTTNAGQTCVEPANLQDEIDELIEQHGAKARCFVRASGTENVVRIYAEAETLELAEELTRRVGSKVKELCK